MKYRKRTACYLLFICSLFLSIFIAGYSLGANRPDHTPSAAGGPPKVIETHPQQPTSNRADNSIPQSDEIIPHFIITGITEDEANYASQMQSAIYSMKESVSIENISFTQATQIAGMVLESPDLYWVESTILCEPYKNGYRIKFKYNMTQEERNAVGEKIRERLLEVKEILGTENNNKEKSTQVNNWIKANVEYAYSSSGLPEKTNETQTIIGPLLEGKGICSGYAKTYCLLMGLWNCNVGYCTGDTASNEFHAWNILDCWPIPLYTDVTSNDILGQDNLLNCIEEKLGVKKEFSVIWFKFFSKNAQ